MKWRTKPATTERWKMSFDPNLPVLFLWCRGVLTKEDAEGRLILSKKRARFELAWKRIEAAAIDGNTDLSTCMVANGGAKVYGITLTGSPGIYDYVVNVDAQGPSGFGSGSMYLAFTDQSGDTYYLSIYSSSRSVHTVRYNSQQPAIVKMWWSDYSFDV